MVTRAGYCEGYGTAGTLPIPLPDTQYLRSRLLQLCRARYLAPDSQRRQEVPAFHLNLHEFQRCVRLTNTKLKTFGSSLLGRGQSLHDFATMSYRQDSAVIVELEAQYCLGQSLETHTHAGVDFHTHPALKAVGVYRQPINSMYSKTTVRVLCNGNDNTVPAYCRTVTT